MAKITEKSAEKELFIYLGNDVTTSEGFLLQKNYILEKSTVEKISDKDVREKIVSLSEYTKNKNKEVK